MHLSTFTSVAASLLGYVLAEPVPVHFPLPPTEDGHYIVTFRTDAMTSSALDQVTTFFNDNHVNTQVLYEYNIGNFRGFAAQISSGSLATLVATPYNETVSHSCHSSRKPKTEHEIRTRGERNKC